MRIKEMTVVNFRALENATMSFSPTTAIIGSNNAGKSAFLKALELFSRMHQRYPMKIFMKEIMKNLL